MVGDSKDGFAYDFSIKDSITNDSASIRYEEGYKSDLKKVKISVIGIFNTKTYKGGYGIKADGMKELLSNFDKYFIMPLKQQPNVKLTLMPKEFSLY
ncbi:MAG: hypothetical protein ABIN91_12770 [Mucilaginibacter sp.]|uniref:hypothetical protein n=1 Tax=Mucilaginibacter sp. TaxID=1882438 RepID=UPI00326562E4